MKDHLNLSDLLLQSIDQCASNIALEIGEIRLTYGELYDRARPLIHYLEKEKPRRAAILMNRGVNNYISLFACALIGVTYIPILKTTDQALLEYIFELTETDLVITEEAFLSELDILVTGIKRPVNCIIIEKLSPLSIHHRMSVLNNSYAYIMMTSGSTGKPKAVGVGHAQLVHYLNVTRSRCAPSGSDRFAQVTELTFDLSVHDIFLCWSVGACLCPFVGENYLELANFFEQKKITSALLVPSIIVGLERYKKLQERYFKTLKTLLFCGEPLPNTIVKKMLDLLPEHAHIENTYGPTEATIAFTSFLCQPDSIFLNTDMHKIIPIGKAFSGLLTRVIKDERDCSVGEIGELWLGGPQVVEGYINAPELSAERFVEKDGVHWYKSGDLAMKDLEGNLHFKGRIDDQWQVRGQRIERLDLETQLRNFLTQTELAVIPSPITENGLVLGIALIFVSDSPEEEVSIRKQCQINCVSPFIPTAYIRVSALPLNVNGKVDYKALCQRYQKIERC